MVFPFWYLLTQVVLDNGPLTACVGVGVAGAQGGGVALKPEDFARAMKLCKFATSALQYEDTKTAVDNLSKALSLLTTGHE